MSKRRNGDKKLNGPTVNAAFPSPDPWSKRQITSERSEAITLMVDKGYTSRGYETAKFDHMRDAFHEGIGTIKSLGYSPEDYMHFFPAFTGEMTLLKYLSLYELYKDTLDVAGHIGELGMFKGAASLLFAKLTKIYEPYAATLVHGFDWFQGGGNLTDREKAVVSDGAYQESEARVRALIDAQHLSNIVKVHNLDLSSADVDTFLEDHPHLYFKLVLVDAGIESVLRKSIPAFWDRMTTGGIMVFDHYSFETAPSEAGLINALLPGVPVKAVRPGWMPVAYVIKGT